MKSSMFNELLESVQEADAIMRCKAKLGRVFEYPDPAVRAIRERTGLSQNKFATLIGVKPSTLRNWEQGRRQPTGPAKALLRILEADTENAVRALQPKKNRAAG
jgi:putative transcriptional regulator